ncbi:unnamed protein product [Thelazia callipaeda]|uniref:Integrase_H2C2 domain-containing protein n=1 Tax=Thelazia callipaeda TaxID=103827 RepID=A0A0N5CMF2_THECL|nr:unnamed protein product [Thelazia callipaeda]
MSGDDGGVDSKYEKEGEDLEVTLLTEPSSDEKKCVYGGFSDEAYEELVLYHRSKEIPKRLEGHLKHRIDCFKRKAKRFQLIEGTDQLIYIGFKPDQTTVGQFVVKKNDVEKILTQAHLESNHGGLNATRKMVSTKFYWNSITNDVEQFIKQCPRCRITRMRYVASNNVPWRKGARYGDIYSASWDGSDDDYTLCDRTQNRIWKVSSEWNGDYMSNISEADFIVPPPWKRDRSSSNAVLVDELLSADIDIENDDELGSAKSYEKIDPQMLLPHYFRVKPTHQIQNRSRSADWYEKEQGLEYRESYGNGGETYLEDDFIVGENVESIPSTGDGKIISDVLDVGMNRYAALSHFLVAKFLPVLTKDTLCKNKVVDSGTVKRRHVEDGRECIIETDRKYFMVEADQLLQLFKSYRCSGCGEKLKQVTLYADSPVPTVTYRCSKCEQAVWFGQKIE